MIKNKGLIEFEKVIAVFYYIISFVYLIITLLHIIKAPQLNILFVVFGLIIIVLFFFSGEGLRKGKSWGKIVALLASSLLILIELSREFIKGEMINLTDILIIYTFGSISIYLLISVIRQYLRRE